MKARILKRTREVPGMLGDVVEVDAITGNRLACIGVLQILAHDPAPPVYRPPAKERDFRPKWLKQAEAAGEDVSGITSASQLIKPTTPPKDDDDATDEG